MSTWPPKTNYAAGDILTAAQMTDIGNQMTPLGYTAGKNKIINGDFGIWQRGTSFTPASSANIFTADRFSCTAIFSAGTTTISQQTFTPGTAPVSGYEGSYFHRITLGSTATYFEMSQKIEDVRTFAGQNITISFWAKASSAVTVKSLFRQNFGTGGSANVDNTVSVNLTTSWQRFTRSIEPLGSMSGKTIGANSYLQMYLYQDTGALGGLSIDTWGWQVEAGSVATAFQTATGTKQGELAACQRYYVRWTAPDAYTLWGLGVNTSSTGGNAVLPLPVTMRTKPTILDYSTLGVAGGGGAVIALTSASINYASDKNVSLGISVASGLTAANPHQLFSNNSTSAYIGISAEL